MKTINETRIAAIRVIEDVIRLQSNVNKGCFSDAAKLNEQKERLPAIKEWAIKNNQINAINHWFGSAFFGHLQFIASDYATFFNA